MNTASAVAAAESRGDSRTALALRDAWTRRQYGALSDFEVSDWAMSVDRFIIEHDAYCCCDEWSYCPTSEPRRLLAALNHEADRRARLGITVSKDTDPSFERDFAPFGPEWEREQMERLAA